LAWKLTRKGKTYRKGRAKVTGNKAGIKIPHLSKLKKGRYTLTVGGPSGFKATIRI
jgi:hypothetical protein